MKRILVLDIWKGSQGGAGKSALYGELSRLYRLEFAPFSAPRLFSVSKYVRSFHPVMDRWKERKAFLDETMQKRPETFRLMTEAWNESLRGMGGYDAILQMGSLFGPVEAPPGMPYFSYHDSAVANLDAMWKGWMPPDFDSFREEWYSLERGMLERMDAIMTYSGFVKETMTGVYGIDPGRVHVVGSALKMPDEYEVDPSKRGKGVLFVTTDFERKGGDDIIGIFDRVAAEVPGATLTVVGPVPARLSSMKRPWLELLGPLKRAELAEVYRRSSVLLHPARFDAFPSVILEAANFEMPCVGSRVCGIPEIIVEGETGLLADPGDAGAFAGKLIYLLKNADILTEMGKKAKKSVRERFHPKVVAGRMNAVIAGRLR